MQELKIGHSGKHNAHIIVILRLCFFLPFYYLLFIRISAYVCIGIYACIINNYVCYIYKLYICACRECVKMETEEKRNQTNNFPFYESER